MYNPTIQDPESQFTSIDLINLKSGENKSERDDNMFTYVTVPNGVAKRWNMQTAKVV